MDILVQYFVCWQRVCNPVAVLRSTQLHPSVFGFAPPVWHGAIIFVTMNNISLLRYVYQNDWESRTDDAWWNFHVQKFHMPKLMGDLKGMGSLDHKNFETLHPQFRRARTAAGGILAGDAWVVFCVIIARVVLMSYNVKWSFSVCNRTLKCAFSRLTCG